MTFDTKDTDTFYVVLDKHQGYLNWNRENRLHQKPCVMLACCRKLICKQRPVLPGDPAKLRMKSYDQKPNNLTENNKCYLRASQSELLNSMFNHIFNYY